MTYASRIETKKYVKFQVRGSGNFRFSPSTAETMSEETETVKIGEAVEVEAETSGSRTTLDDVIDVTKVWDAELRACQSLIRSLNRNTPSNELAEKKRFFKRVRAPGTRWSAWLTAQHRRSSSCRSKTRTRAT